MSSAGTDFLFRVLGRTEKAGGDLTRAVVEGPRLRKQMAILDRLNELKIQGEALSLEKGRQDITVGQAKLEDVKRQAEAFRTQQALQLGGVRAVGSPEMTPDALAASTPGLDPSLASGVLYGADQRRREDVLKGLVPVREALSGNQTGTAFVTPEEGTFVPTLRPPAPFSMLTGAAGFGGLDSVTPDVQARIQELAQRVVSGEMSIDTARGLLGGVKSGLGGALLEAVTKTQARVAPPKVREALADISRTENLLLSVKDVVRQIEAAPDLQTKAEKSILLENYTMAIGTLLARGFGERGVVTDRDRAAAIGIVPGWKATNFAPGFAEEKLKILDDLIARNKSVYTGSYFNEIPAVGAGGGQVGGTEDLTPEEQAAYERFMSRRAQ